MESKFTPKGIHRIARGIESAYLPCSIKRAQGVFLTSEDNKEYIDFVMGKGSVTLGHGNDRLSETLIKQIKDGQQYSITPEKYERLAEKLVTLEESCFDKAIFLKNGSDAVKLSMRISRAYTEAEVILFCGYHSWQDEFLPNTWPSQGVSQVSQKMVINFFYDLGYLEELVSKHNGNIAAVIVTPEPGLVPDEFYKQVESICLRAKALFIMDEVKCGYHENILGVTSLLGLRPDMVLLSKGVANGYPISVVLGRGSVIDKSDGSIVFGTYFYDAYGFSLALETLEIYHQENVIEALRDIGGRLTDGLLDIFKSTNTQAKMTGSLAMPILVFSNRDEEKYFYEELLKRGVMMFPNDNIGLATAHTEKLIDATLSKSFDILKMKPNHFMTVEKNDFKESVKALSMKKMIKPGEYSVRWL